MKRWTVALMIVAALATGTLAEEEPNGITIDPHWSIEGGMGLGATGEDLIRAAALYWPNYANDGGVGVVVMGGDMLPTDKVAVGPTVEFPTGAIYSAVANEVLPDPWAAAFGDLVTDIRPYGCLSVMFDEDFNPIVGVGTAIRLWPNKAIQPTLRTEWLEPCGSSDLAKDLSGWWTTFSVAVYF